MCVFNDFTFAKSVKKKKKIKREFKMGNFPTMTVGFHQLNENKTKFKNFGVSSSMFRRKYFLNATPF